jgi:hypothetical protein
MPKCIMNILFVSDDIRDILPMCYEIIDNSLNEILFFDKEPCP